MRNTKDVRTRRGRGRLWALLLLPALVAGSACDSLLDVENPNNVKEVDLDDPNAAPALVNGALTTLAWAWSAMILDHGAASDEFFWVGSRDAYFQLDIGNLSDPNNEFTDGNYPTISQARWWSDEAIKRLEKFRTDGKLANEVDLARAYLYSGFIYTAIANHFDDFVIGSNRKEASPPVGDANMNKLYDTAIGNIDKGLTIARARNQASLELQLLATRAWANWSKGMWSKVNPRGTIAANPLVQSAAAAADAQAFLGKSPGINWRWAFAFAVSTTGSSSTGAWVNSRLEFRQGTPYINPTANNKDYASTKMTDLIDTGKLSPELDKRAKEFDNGQLYNPEVAVNAREMHLILPEHELASGNTAGFETHINHIRSADGLTPWSASNSAHPSAQNMLIHMRQTNLYLMARRLHDHYRFKVPSVDWTASSEAVRTPGTFFPITRIERDANPNISK